MQRMVDVDLDKGLPYPDQHHQCRQFMYLVISLLVLRASIYVFSYFPFGFEGRIWDLIVSVPDHCLSFLLCFRQLLKLRPWKEERC